MAWTDPECIEIFEKYWADGGARCPTCQAVARFNYAAFMGGYFLTGSCPRGCGGFKMQKGDDPKAASFREWTDEEQGKIVDDHFNQTQSKCPVDGAELEVTESVYFEGTIVTATCKRCGHLLSKTFPRG